MKTLQIGKTPSAYILGEQRVANVRKEQRQELFLQGLLQEENTHSLPGSTDKNVSSWYGMEGIFHLKRVLSSAFRKNGRAGQGRGWSEHLLPPAIF